jgi:uncharacterized membrane protein
MFGAARYDGYTGQWGRGQARSRRSGRGVVYAPLAMPFLAAGLIALLVLLAFVQVGVFSYALGRLGIGPQAAVLVLLASLAGSVINIPIARLRGNVTQLRQMVTVFGMRYVVPVVRSTKTTIAVNVGGALVPVALSAYLIAHDRLGWLALAAVLIVALFTHSVARPVRGLGIAVPALLPGIFAAAVALILHPAAVAGLAYVGGTLGTLLGADLLNLHKIRRLGAPVASIGGAGTFDGVFLTGIVAVLLAAIF